MTADRLEQALRTIRDWPARGGSMLDGPKHVAAEALAAHDAAKAPAEGALEAAFAWVEEAVEYVNDETCSPSLEREGRALLHRLREAIKASNVQPKGTADDLRAAFEKWAQSTPPDERTNWEVFQAGARAASTQAPAPAHAALNEDAIDWPDVESMAHSACEEALAFGVAHDVFHRHMRAVMDKTAQAFRAAVVSPAVAPEVLAFGDGLAAARIGMPTSHAYLCNPNNDGSELARAYDAGVKFASAHE